MSDAIPADAITVLPREPHMEIFDPRSRDVWLCQQPISAEDYQAFCCEPPLIKAGHGRSAFDSAYFRQSPDLQGALEVREMNGLRLVRVARPQAFAGMPRGDEPTCLMVEKTHVLGYSAGRSLRLARLPEGHWLVEHTLPLYGALIEPPTSWQLLTVELEQDWTCELSGVVPVYFFRNLQSFAGGLDEAILPPELSRQLGA